MASKFYHIIALADKKPTGDVIRGSHVSRMSIEAYGHKFTVQAHLRAKDRGYTVAICDSLQEAIDWIHKSFGG